MRRRSEGSAMSEFVILSVFASVLIYYGLMGAAEPSLLGGGRGPLNTSVGAGTGALLDRVDEKAVAAPGLMQALHYKQEEFIEEIYKL